MSIRSSKISAGVTDNNKVTKRVENSWVLLVKNELLENSSFTIITLPHPATGKDSKYCLGNNKIYEIVTYDEPYRSWFIGNTVKSDPSVQILTPINPLFLVLPRLREQCRNRAMLLEDLLSEKGFDKIVSCLKDLEKIADLKVSSDIIAYKYNENKTLNWLEARVRKLAAVLKEKNIHVTPGAASATFLTSTINNDDVDDEFYLKYAHGLVSEYLQVDLIVSLEKQFNFKPELIEKLAKKRKSETGDISKVNKKVKSESIEEVCEENTITAVKKEAPLTTKEKARRKAASGTKAISSFFKKS